MTSGTIFDIQEFCVHDGPGSRIVVFMKGCPLRCRWCHNPEGFKTEPELIRGAACIKCGQCNEAARMLKEEYSTKISHLCPQNCLRVAGKKFEPEELADELMKYKDTLSILGGGVTFSGGECLMQSHFVAKVLSNLTGIHRAIETSGYADPEDFMNVVKFTDLVMLDLKIINDRKHICWTGVSNSRIINNLNLLIKSNKEFIIRIPVIPAVNDSIQNFRETAELIKSAPGLLHVELMPYNANAGAKYELIGEKYDPGFDESISLRLESAAVFDEYNISYRIL